MLPNVVFLVGRIRRPDFRLTASGKPVLNAKLAVLSGEHITMVDLVFWSAVAEKAKELIDFSARPRVMIQGALRQDKWTNANGEPRMKLSVKVNKFFILSEIWKEEEEEPYLEQET